MSPAATLLSFVAETTSKDREVAASHHGDTPYSGDSITSVPVTPYTTSVDVNSADPGWHEPPSRPGCSEHVGSATGHLPIGDGPDETAQLAPDSAPNDQIWTVGAFHRHHAYTTQNGGDARGRAVQANHAA